MSHSFSYDLPLADAPTAAQARVQQSVVDQVTKSAGMRSASAPSADSMMFVPKWGWPLAAAVARRASGEKISLKFNAAGAGTSVAVAGKVGGGSQIVATREFWEDALGTS